MDQEKVFGEALERIEGFFDFQNIDLQKTQNLHFLKGVSPWFLSTNENFSFFSFKEKFMKKKC